MIMGSCPGHKAPKSVFLSGKDNGKIILSTVPRFPPRGS